MEIEGGCSGGGGWGQIGARSDSVRAEVLGSFVGDLYVGGRGEIEYWVSWEVVRRGEKVEGFFGKQRNEQSKQGIEG